MLGSWLRGSWLLGSWLRAHRFCINNGAMIAQAGWEWRWWPSASERAESGEGFDCVQRGRDGEQPVDRRRGRCGEGGSAFDAVGTVEACAGWAVGCSGTRVVHQRRSNHQ